jgi:flagellar basal-body rod protein FlgB
LFLTEIANSGAIPMLEKTLAFTEARNRMLATNIANITTPNYRAKQLDVNAFQATLREAAAQRAARGGEFQMDSTNEFHVDETGSLRVTPSEEPVENVLFQDGTNARIERQMADLAENTMMNQVANELLKGKFATLEKAIRGRL